ELIQVVLHEPAAVAWLAGGVPVAALRDGPLRAILQACYDLQEQGQSPSYENLMVRLDDPALRSLATDLVASAGLSAPEPDPLSQGVRPAPWQDCLERMLPVLQERQRQARLADLKKALEQTDRQADPDAYRAVELEYRRLL